MEQIKTIGRKRGVVLAASGLNRLQAAILHVEIKENNNNRFTLAQLSTRTNVSTRTLSRLWSLNAIDRKTLQLCFNAFGLELCSEDFTIISEPHQAKTSKLLLVSSKEKLDKSEFFCSYPDGPVSLDSPLYIERPPIEKLGYQELTQPGCIIRISSPRGMGKSSLVLRLLDFAQQQDYHTVNLDCHQIDALSLSDLNQFLRSLCWRVAKGLGIDPTLGMNWDEEVSSKLNCSFYFKTYLLKQIESPVVLVLEQVDRLFEYPQLAQEFFHLLRSWHEEARQDTDWQKLRLVVVYSTEVYVTLDIDRSPFNIGLPLRLPEFTHQQVKELARQHDLNWDSGEEVTQLISLVGGHPTLIQIALYYLCRQEITLEDLVQESFANGGIYRYHLWRHWVMLQKIPGLAEIYTKVVKAESSISLNPFETYKLESLGLIGYEGSMIRPRCELYRAYFKKQLSTNIR